MTETKPEPKHTGRPKLYNSAADRQRAYNERKREEARDAERQRQAQIAHENEIKAAVRRIIGDDLAVSPGFYAGRATSGNYRRNNNADYLFAEKYAEQIARAIKNGQFWIS